MQVTTTDRFRGMDKMCDPDMEAVEFILKAHPATIDHDDNSNCLRVMSRRFQFEIGVFSSYVRTQIWAKVAGTTCEEYPDIEDIRQQACPCVPSRDFKEYFMERCRHFYQLQLRLELTEEEGKNSLGFYDDDEVFEDLQNDPDYLGN
jgi:hypothetical protein